MTTLFGFQLPAFFGSTGYFSTPNELLKTKAEKKLKEMLNPAPDPKFQALFQQMQAAAQEAAAAQPLTEQTAATLADTAAAVNTAAESAINAVNSAHTAAEAVASTAQTISEKADTALKSVGPSTPTANAKKALLSRLISSGAAALKAAPGKLFFFAMLPVVTYLYNEDNNLLNVHVLIEITKRKVYKIEIGSHNSKKVFEFTAAPGEELTFSNSLAHDYVSTQVMPSFTNTTSLLGRVLSPLTSLICPRINEQHIYSVLIKDPTSNNPFLAQGPIIKNIQLSADEILRITHEPTSIMPSQLKRTDIHLASSEELQSSSPDQWDRLKLINIKVTDDEPVKRVEWASGEYMAVHS